MQVKNPLAFAKTKLQYFFSGSRIIPYGGIMIPGEMLAAIGFDKKVDASCKPSKDYLNSEILKAMLIGILHGDPDFTAIHETDDDVEFYCQAMRMRKMPSEPTMRQRIIEIGSSLKHVMRQMSIDLLKTYGVEPSALESGYVPIDIDVSPFIDEKCKKEGISMTYKRKEGYAPIFAYIGTEGYLLAMELRPGKQHCQNGTPEFLKEVIAAARQLTDKPLLIRLDSGNDSSDNIGLCMEECLRGGQVHFIIKRNLRKESPGEWLDELRKGCTNVKRERDGKEEYIGQTFRNVTYQAGNDAEGRPIEKTVGIRTIYDITERTCDHDGQMYVFPKVECDMYSVNVDFPDEEIIELYHKHGEMEQYHSEIKTDLGAEQLPSKHFEANELVLELVQLAYNMLRMIGQESLGMDGLPLKRPVKRRRLLTVMMHVIMAPVLVTKHARQTRVDLGQSNAWRGAVATIWKKFRKILP